MINILLDNQANQNQQNAFNPISNFTNQIINPQQNSFIKPNLGSTQTNPPGSLFGNAPAQQNTLFGSQNLSTGSNLFAKPPTNIQAQQSNLTFGGAANQMPLSNIPNQMGLSQGFPFTYNQTKILTLMPGNQTKYEKVNSLQSNELKELIKLVEVNFENNKLYLNNLETTITNLQENYKIIQSEAFNIAKFTKVINQKNTKLKFIFQNFNNELKIQNEVLNKNRENCKILEHHPSMKINVPSDYLFDLVNEMEDYVKSQVKQISDLESLFNLNYQKEIGSIKMNSDVIEQIIVSLYESLIGLTNETSKICESVERIKQIYGDFLKNNLGWKEYEIENKFRQSFNPNKLYENQI